MNPINENRRSGRGRETTVAAVLARLYREIRVLRDFVPLALKIDIPPSDATRGATGKTRRRALIDHCMDPRYLENVANGGERFALDGTPSGEVSELQRRAAKARLEGIAWEAEKRKAARLAKQRRRE